MLGVVGLTFCNLFPFLIVNRYVGFQFNAYHTVRTARFSKKSFRSDVGEIKKMSVLTPRNVR